MKERITFIWVVKRCITHFFKMKMIMDEHMTCSKFQKETIGNFWLKSIDPKLSNYNINPNSKNICCYNWFLQKKNNLYISMQQINLYEIPEIA